MNLRSRAVPLAATLAILSAVLLAPGSSAQDKMKDGMGKGDTMMKKDDMSKDKMKKDTMGGGDMKKGDTMMKKDEMKK